MILVDTSVWIDHLRTPDAVLRDRLDGDRILAHPAVIGELALGRIADRDAVLDSLRDMPQAVPAADEEVLGLIEAHRLAGSGIGWADAHLLASVLLTAGATLWTRDRRLTSAAHQLGVMTESD